MKTSTMIRLLVPALAAACSCWALPENAHTLASPDGTLQLSLHHRAEAGLTYALAADGRELIQPSPVGHAVDGKPRLGTWAGVTSRSVP